MAEQQDPIASVLQAAPATDSARHDAWDAFYNSTSKDDLAEKLKAIDLPSGVKHDLWEMKSRQQPKEVALTVSGGEQLADVPAALHTAPQTFDDTPLPDDWKTRLGAAMEGMAHPKTWADIGALILGGADSKALNQGASLAAEAAAPATNALASIPVRTIARAAAKTAGAALDNPLVGVFSPRARSAGEMLTRAGAAIGKTVPRTVAPTVAQAAPVVAEAAPVVAEAAPVAAAAPKAAPGGPIYHPDPTMQNAFATKAAERKAAADALVEAAKKATKVKAAPVLGKNIVTVKNGIPDLNPSELTQAIKWSQEGVEPATIIDRLNALREVQTEGSPFANLPTPEQAAAEVKARPHYIKYPKKSR